MKNSARNRIIIWSIVTAVLICMLAVGINTFSKYSIYKNIPFIKIFDDEIDSDFEGYSSGSAEFLPEQVDSIDIDWIAGKVEVVSGDTDKIQIYETSSSDITGGKTMKYKLDGTTLKINAGGDYTLSQIISFGNYHDMNKNLTVTVPRAKSLDSLEVDAASADISISCEKINEVKTDTASGAVTIDGTKGSKAEADSASGNITIRGDFESVDTESVSGETEITADCAKLDTQSVSGTITATAGEKLTYAKAYSVSGTVSISLPENNQGFTAEYETVSGDFSSDFEGRSSDGDFVSGNGYVRISLETVSGNMMINKK